MKIDLKTFSKIALPGILGIAILQGCTSDDQSLPANIDYSVIEELNEPYQPFEPELGAAVPKTSERTMVSASLPYPPFNPHDIKTVGPDGWNDRDQLLNAGTGGVKFNLLWSQWQPEANLNPNNPNTFTYDGKVWLIASTRDKEIRWYSERGMKVTAVLYGTPAWARPKNTAKFGRKVPIVDDKFIAPDNPEDFARFAGMLAKRFNGANGNGRIVNFVIQNEVNALDWYNPGCGTDAAPCSIEDRIDSYASIFNLSYDRIIAEQPHAKVMYSFDHHFGQTYAQAQRYSSAQRFIEELEPKVGDRKWRLAFHSYPPDLFKPAFGPFDYPKITFGNIGILASYLRQRFPDKPYTWDIHLTENGINSSPPSSEEQMKKQMKVATRNILGTPGIETFYYHRLMDHRQEGKFTPGLFNSQKKAKQAWQTWSGNNLYNSNPPRLDDGYEVLPYVKLERSVHPTRGHWASTRQAPGGYTTEASFLLLREPADNTTLLFECHDADAKATYISAELSCDGHQNFGPVGYIYNFNNAANTRAPLYSIKLPRADYLISKSPNEGGGEPTLLGFVDSSRVRQQAEPDHDLSYFDTSVQTSGQSNASSIATETVHQEWGDCAGDNEPSCTFIRFESQPNQTHALSCNNGSQDNASILLSYGNTKTSSLQNMGRTQSGAGAGVTYTIPIIIDDDATWAIITLQSETETTPECVVISSGGLQIGAATSSLSSGLLHNGSFESDITDWQFCQQDSSQLSTENTHQGATAAQISNGNCLYQEIEIEPDTAYIASCFAIADNEATGQTTFRFALANNSYQTLVDNEQLITGSTWKEYSATLTAPEYSKYAVISVESSDTASIDSCSINQVSND